MRKAPEVDDLYRLRHSTAHVLAQAVQHLFPEAKTTIGPATEEGFYYDFDRDTAFTPEDLQALEAEMARCIAANPRIEGREVSPDEARSQFEDNPYKLELIDE